MATKPKLKAASIAQTVAAFNDESSNAKAASISPKLQSVLENLQPSLHTGGLILLSADANDVGPDDIAGNLMIYGASVIDCALHGGEFPALPEAVTAQIVGKISGTGRWVLIGSMIGIGALQGQLAKVNPKAATAFRYINQVLTALLTTGVVPVAPALLTE